MSKCDSLEDAIGHDHHKILADKHASPAALVELYIWALWFIEAELFPAIEFPDEAHAYVPALWKYLLSYRLADAEEFPEGA
jgi:hypothetical protein